MDTVKLDVFVADKNPDRVSAARKSGDQGRGGRTLSEEWKEIQRARLSRKVFEDSSYAKQLVVAQTSPVYNANGELIPTVTTTDKAV